MAVMVVTAETYGALVAAMEALTVVLLASALASLAQAAGSRRNFFIAYHTRFGWSASNQLWGCMRCRVLSRWRLMTVYVETRTDEIDEGGW